MPLNPIYTEPPKRKPGRPTLSPRGRGQKVVLYLRPDQLAWLRAEAERRRLASASRLVSGWIDNAIKGQGPES